MKVTLKVGEPVAAWSRVALEHVEDSRTTWLKVPLGSFRHFQMTSVESISIGWKALPKAQRVAHTLGHVPPTVSTLCGHTCWCLTGASPGEPRRPPSSPAGRKAKEPTEELGAESDSFPEELSQPCLGTCSSALFRKLLVGEPVTDPGNF